MSKLSEALIEIIQGDVISDSLQLNTYSKDASIFEITPQVVVCPKNSDDIQALVHYCITHSGTTLTPRSAGTDMSGGPLSDSIVLDMTKHFNQIFEMGTDFAVTEPGVFYRDFEKETLKHNLLLPCFTASRDINTVGGMVGNNSAGEKTLSYGQTERYVLELKVILADGNEYLIRPLTKPELDQKLLQNDFEGNLYKQIYELVTSNQQLITSARPNVSKNSSGYYLWNVWDGQSFNLCKLLVGSQGTLGIITQIKFQLIQPQNFATNLIIELPNLDNLGEIINTVLSQTPESFECFDNLTIKYALKYLPEVTKELFRSDYLPKLVLLVEFADDTPSLCNLKATTTQNDLNSLKVTSKIVSTKDGQKYWKIRRESFNLLRLHSQNLKTAPFIDDWVIKPEFLAEFLPKLEIIFGDYKEQLIYTIAGHIGDGNFHIIPLMDLEREDSLKIISQLSSRVYNLVFEYKGSMTAEHNDGLIRSPFLDQMYGEEVFQLFKQVKQIFDPKNIFNPHKKTDATFKYSFDHLSSSQVHPHGS